MLQRKAINSVARLKQKPVDPNQDLLNGLTPSFFMLSNDRIVRKTAREVERNPDVLPIIERENPTLASALEKLSPKLRAIAGNGAAPAGEPQGNI